MTTYLRLVHETWSGSAKGFENSLDIRTVELLEGRFLRFSLHDISEARAAWESHDLFPLVRDPGERSTIWNRLEEVSVRIPSIFTFRMDTLHLELASKAVKTLLDS